MSSGDKTKQASYDSAADSDIELDMEQKGAPAAKKQKTAKKPTVTVEEIHERMQKADAQEEKLAYRIKMLETRLAMANMQHMKLECDRMKNRLTLKELGAV